MSEAINTLYFLWIFKITSEELSKIRQKVIKPKEFKNKQIMLMTVLKEKFLKNTYKTALIKLAEGYMNKNMFSELSNEKKKVLHFKFLELISKISQIRLP